MNTEERIKELEHELSVASKWADDRADHVNDLIAENVRLREELETARKSNARIAGLLKKWNAPGAIKDQLGIWDEIEEFILSNARDHRPLPESAVTTRKESNE
jgi:septation ring formation regulator EzrA